MEKKLANKEALAERIRRIAKQEPQDQWVLDYWEEIKTRTLVPLQVDPHEQYSKRIEREIELNYDEVNYEATDEFITGVLMRELNANIDTLKRFTNIQMMAIGHLAYNGMTGHALAIDVSRKPLSEYLVSQVVKRAYRTKSSSDKNYRKSFNGLFYTIPGVNKYGENVISRLLDDSIRSIHIDLKHSDVPTREFLLSRYDSLRLSPICSHCAVTGISKNFSSPVVDEYSLLKSSLARKFYPFSINLYNEEVVRICTAKNKQGDKVGGIIGLPLEERVLGRYVNNKVEYPLKIKLSNQPQLLKKVTRCKRIKYTERGLEYLQKTDHPLFQQVAQQYLEAYTSDINFDRVASIDGIAKPATKKILSGLSGRLSKCRSLPAKCFSYRGSHPFSPERRLRSYLSSVL